MFLATTLLYPCALAALCAGAGLAVDRASGSFLPASLLVSVGAAALIALTQLSTYAYPLARASPYIALALALAGFALGRGRARSAARRLRARPWPAIASLLAYAIALAPVLAAGRPSFSSYMALADSAVHMTGADYLMSHGQHYAHLDLRNSYGQFIHDYYGSSYPSGADTLFGASGLLLGLPLIWAFQPFNAFVLASAVGPVWLLARRVRLDGAWAALAALAAVMPALVYAYELLGSIKELAALAMLLALGALVAVHRRWLGAAPARAMPFSLVLAAGVSALGPAFGAWALAAVLVLALVLARRLRGGRGRAAGGPGGPGGSSEALRGGRGRAAGRPGGPGGSSEALPAARALRQLGVAALALLIAAWPTWVDLPGALRVAGAIATTSNSGNLGAPLRAIQALGVWLNGSYKLAPAGAALTATHVLIALTLACALLGAAHVLALRAYALAGWLAATLLASLVVSESVATWADAKALVLTSPVVVLLAWAGVGALRARVRAAAAAPLALALAGGVLASDALQYHSFDLAPTARYRELALVGSRFAGEGPTLLTDFDEYSLYELRDLDVGGPDFVYPPRALAAAAGGYGDRVDLSRVAPSALLRYPLIVTRRDPAAERPPAAYRLRWQGAYYQVWGRRAGAPAARAHVALSGSAAAQCARIGAVAGRARDVRAGAAGARGTGAHAAGERGVSAPAGATERLVAAQAPELVRVRLARASRPRTWGHERRGLVMSTPGRLSASFVLPRAGVWDVWVQGQLMPEVQLAVDGRRIAWIAGQLDGNSLVPDTVPPVAVPLAAGAHNVTVTRGGFSLAPGDGGSAVLDAIFLTPAHADPSGALRGAEPADWRSLCGRRYEWIEIVPS
jgi:hypothetical protein